MVEFKGTKGILNTMSANQFAVPYIIYHENLTIFHCYGEEIEAKENANLVIDAFSTIDKCDLFPSQLLEQRNEMLMMLHKVCLEGFSEDEIKQLINKVNKNNESQESF